METTTTQDKAWGMEQCPPSRSTFVATASGTFVVLTLALVVVDFIPEPPVSAAEDSMPSIVAEAGFSGASLAPTDTVSENPTPAPALPVRVRIPSIGVDTTVMTPESTDVDVLDRSLLVGAVHYPGSALLGEDGNVLLFGHSSYLPVVQNKAFQAFNELGSLEPGDSIEVHSAEHTYHYKVKGVQLSKASATTISFAADEPLLTLATCNTFGEKQDRWVITATFERITSRE